VDSEKEDREKEAENSRRILESSQIQVGERESTLCFPTNG